MSGDDMQLTMASIPSFLSSLSPNSPVKYHSRYHVLPQNANDMFSLLSHVLPERRERESHARTEGSVYMPSFPFSLYKLPVQKRKTNTISVFRFSICHKKKGKRLQANYPRFPNRPPPYMSENEKRYNKPFFVFSASERKTKQRHSFSVFRFPFSVRREASWFVHVLRGSDRVSGGSV